MSGLVDVLSHLDDPRLVEPAAPLLDRAARAGVSDVLSAGVDPLVPVGDLPGADGVRVWRAFGIHPRACGVNLADQLDALERLLGGPDVVAIGECGLDRREGAPPLDLQQRALRAQLELAHRRELPVALHVVEATGAFFDVLIDAPAFDGFVHGFSGAPEVAARLVDRGLSISFGGQVANDKARRCRMSAAVVPADRLLIESGTPDHRPATAGPGLSEPADLRHVLDALAPLRQETADDLGRLTADNARALLRLPPATR